MTRRQSFGVAVLAVAAVLAFAFLTPKESSGSGDLEVHHDIANEAVSPAKKLQSPGVRAATARVEGAASTLDDETVPRKGGEHALRATFPPLADLSHVASFGNVDERPNNFQFVEDRGDGTQDTWYGDLDSKGRRDGTWVSWRNGRPRGLKTYQHGTPVGPQALFYPNATVEAYYPRIDIHGRVQGLGWRWREDGSPQAAITFVDNRPNGPSIEIGTDGEIVVVD